jgi:hypothetical protein
VRFKLSNRCAHIRRVRSLELATVLLFVALSRLLLLPSGGRRAGMGPNAGDSPPLRGWLPAASTSTGTAGSFVAMREERGEMNALYLKECTVLVRERPALCCPCVVGVGCFLFVRLKHSRARGEADGGSAVQEKRAPSMHLPFGPPVVALRPRSPLSRLSAGKKNNPPSSRPAKPNRAAEKATERRGRGKEGLFSPPVRPRVQRALPLSPLRRGFSHCCGSVTAGSS